jgi:hypothetical protein
MRFSFDATEKYIPTYFMLFYSHSDIIIRSVTVNWEYSHGDPLRWPRNTLYLQKLALTSSTSGGRSVSIVRLRTKATEFSFLF